MLTSSATESKWFSMSQQGYLVELAGYITVGQDSYLLLLCQSK